MTQNAPELLPSLKHALKQRGFYDSGILQLYKRGQVFGLVRLLDKILEMQIQGFKDGLIEAEIEISRKIICSSSASLAIQFPMSSVFVVYPRRRATPQLFRYESWQSKSLDHPEIRVNILRSRP